jgi:hypothetical protein
VGKGPLEIGTPIPFLCVAQGSTFPPKKLPSVGNRTHACALHGGAQGICTMPSTEYFRRQADICLRLSLIASDDEVSSRLIVMAQDYKAKGNAVEAESKSPLTAMVIHSVSPDRETSQS